jgi:predicted Fe-S protein YdhL (DUF1289 family)
MDRLLAEFAAIGIAQALPGLRRMREVAIQGMNAEITKLEALLAQCGGIVPVPARRGRPPKRESAVIAEARRIEASVQNGATHTKSAGSNFWGNMTAEERRAEMARRWKRRKTQVTSNNMPKEVRSKLAIGYWYKMTPEERVKEMARRVAVRSGKAKSIDPRRYEYIKARRAKVQA